jgi:hypothetical protein
MAAPGLPSTIRPIPGVTQSFSPACPELLHSLLKPQDADRVHLVASKLQDVETTLFETLETGDILFIDSSHVVKAGSDVLTLFANILPQLNVGTLSTFMTSSIDSSIRRSG